MSWGTSTKRSKQKPQCHPRKPYYANGLCRKCWRQANYEANRARVLSRNREARLRWKYGLTLAQYERLKQEANGRCCLCGRSGLRLVIDHCHISGRVRGLLCIRCNVALGWLGDNKQKLLRVVAYLTRHGV